MNHPYDHVHPAQRPVEPDHPMVLEGGVIPGDTRFMAQCLFEEMLMAGHSPRDLLAMTRDPNYQALHAARAALGEDALAEILAGAAARVGQFHVEVVEQPIDCPLSRLSLYKNGKTDRQGDFDAQGS